MTNPSTHSKYSSTKDIQGYTEFLGALKSSIRQRQYQALRTVNKELITLYWDIGKLIDERQEAEGWGKAVVERLSADLRDEFGEKSGFQYKTCGICGSFTVNTKHYQISSHWLEKFLGLKTP